MGIRIALTAFVAARPAARARRQGGAGGRSRRRRGWRRCSTPTTTRAGSRCSAPGTPTNNSAEARLGLQPARRAAASRSRSRRRGSPPVPTARSCARLLGIKRELLTNVEGAARTEDLAAKRLQAALWPATGGYYLDQLLADRAAVRATPTLDAAKRFFVDFVRAQGPLPAAADRAPAVRAACPRCRSTCWPASTRFVRTLRGLRSAWRNALASVPRLQPDSADEETLVEILRMQPSAVGHRARAGRRRADVHARRRAAGRAGQDLRFQPRSCERPAAAAVAASRARPSGSSPRCRHARRGAAERPARRGHSRRCARPTFDSAARRRAARACCSALLRHSLLLAQATPR